MFKRFFKLRRELVSLVTQFVFNGFVTVKLINTKEIKVGTHEDALFSYTFQFAP